MNRLAQWLLPMDGRRIQKGIARSYRRKTEGKAGSYRWMSGGKQEETWRKDGGFSFGGALDYGEGWCERRVFFRRKG